MPVKSPGMVVIEVDRDFDGFDELLGMHTWSKFLLNPTKEEIDKSSKVFYCTYNTGRLIEQNGPSGSPSLCSGPLLTFGRLEACKRRGTLVPRMDRQQWVSHISCLHSRSSL